MGRILCYLIVVKFVILLALTKNNQSEPTLISADDDLLKQFLSFLYEKRLDIHSNEDEMLTVGIGHTIVEGDEEYGMPIGTRITEERVQELFKRDLQDAISNVQEMVGSELFEEWSKEIQATLVSIRFNLREDKLSEFKNFVSDLVEKDSKDIPEALNNSYWHHNYIRPKVDKMLEKLQEKVKLREEL